MSTSTKILLSILVLGVIFFNLKSILSALDSIAVWYNSPSTPTTTVKVEKEDEPIVIVPEMHEFILQPGGNTVTIETNGRPFNWDGDRGQWLVQIQNWRGVSMSPSGRIDGWDTDYPGNQIGIPSDVRSISFRLPKRDGLLLTLPVHVVVWYTD